MNFTRPVFPSPVARGRYTSTWAFPRASNPADRSRRRTSEWGQAMSTGLELHTRHRSNLLSTCSLVSVRPRVATALEDKVLQRAVVEVLNAAYGKRRTTGMRKGMKESYVGDLASHGGPGHALATREGAAKRWTGVRTGQLLSREMG